MESAGNYAALVIFLLAILDLLQWCFRNVINAESMMVSVARCLRMIDVQHEKPAKLDYDHKLSVYSPEVNLNDSFRKGAISQEALSYDKTNINDEKMDIVRLANFKMRYRSDLPLVLKGIDLAVKRGQKVGIIGRTGAGKSSIIQSLLRICEPESGS